MKPQRAFVAERAAAQHCTELLRRGPEPAELLPQLARLGDRFARQLADGLAALDGGETPAVTPRPVRETSFAELASGVGALAANSLLTAGAVAVPLLASLDAGALLRLVDKAFGGRGEAPVTLPDRFPLSAQLMIQRVEAMVVERLCAALGADGAVRALRRDGDLHELAPFRADTPLAVLELEVMEGLRAPWLVTLALPFATLAELFGHGDRPPAALAATPRPANPTAAPFADVPLPLTAVLVDMQVPLATISALEPGMVLPVAVARAVPLSVGGSVIARGTVGAQDDRVAIKISTIA